MVSEKGSKNENDFGKLFLIKGSKKGFLLSKNKGKRGYFSIKGACFVQK